MCAAAEYDEDDPYSDFDIPQGVQRGVWIVFTTDCCTWENGDSAGLPHPESLQGIPCPSYLQHGRGMQVALPPQTASHTWDHEGVLAVSEGPGPTSCIVQEKRCSWMRVHTVHTSCVVSEDGAQACCITQECCKETIIKASGILVEG
ncbi:hypothetical protein EMCRGX_G005180 [Ephydatia muelleri]